MCRSTVLIRSDGAAISCGEHCFESAGSRILKPPPGFRYVTATLDGQFVIRNDGNIIVSHPSAEMDIHSVPDCPAGSCYSSVAAGRSHVILIRSDGTACALGQNHHGQCDVPELPQGSYYVAAAAGDYHSVLLRNDGIAIAIGGSFNGQCDIPDLPHDLHYVAVVAGARHTILLRSDGAAVACGANSFGQCDIPSLPSEGKYVAAAAGDRHSILVRNDGKAVANQPRILPITSKLQIPELPGGTTYLDVAAGRHHSVLLRSDGAAVAFGINDYGQCDIMHLSQGMQYLGFQTVCTAWSPRVHKLFPAASQLLAHTVQLLHRGRQDRGGVNIPLDILTSRVLPFAIPPAIIAVHALVFLRNPVSYGTHVGNGAYMVTVTHGEQLKTCKKGHALQQKLLGCDTAQSPHARAVVCMGCTRLLYSNHLIYTCGLCGLDLCASCVDSQEMPLLDYICNTKAARLSKGLLWGTC